MGLRTFLTRNFFTPKMTGAECLGLRWCDLDFENRIIDINHNLVHRRVDEEGGTLHINTPKTKAGERRIPMIEPVYEAFLEEYQIQQLTGFCTQEIEGYKEFVFCSSGGTVTIPQEVNRAIHTIVADYNEEETAKAKKERTAGLKPSFFSSTISNNTGNSSVSAIYLVT